MIDWDALVACPTCKHVLRPNDDDEEAHLRPCPNCGYTLMLVAAEVDDDDDGFCKRIQVTWDEGEGAPLFMEDAAKAIVLAEEFWNKEEAEEQRIEDTLTEMRRERQEAS